MKIWWCEIEEVGWSVPFSGEAECAPSLPEYTGFHTECGWRFLSGRPRKLITGDHPAIPGEATVAIHDET